MDCFVRCLDGLCLAGQGVIHISFLCRLTGRARKLRHLALYLLPLCAIGALPLPALPAIGAQLCLLCGVGRFALGAPWPASWTAAVLAVYTTQLSFGLIGSVEAVLFPGLLGGRLLYPLLVLATLASLAVCAGCCAALVRCLSPSGARPVPQAGALLLPGLFSFAAELYILRTSYRVAPLVSSPAQAGRHGTLLSLQLLGLAALLCAAYACRRLCQGLEAQEALRSLQQAARAQQTYLSEARLRYERTRAFRHDIKNHLTVLDGLLAGGQLDEGRSYLQELEAASAALSLPCRTGSPLVDVLLGEKLGLAEALGIETEVSLLLPSPCGVDDLDLCVIFANALDNALAACRAVAQGPRSIRISGRRQGALYLLSFGNSCLEGPLPPAGTGLSNIRSAAERYHGAVLAEKTGSWFSLDVLLDLCPGGRTDG